LAALTVLFLAGGLLAAAGAASAKPVVSRARVLHRSDAAAHPHHALIPAHAGVLPRRDATVTSLNWSGYADLPASGQNVTSVTGNWVVPSVQLAPPGFSAMWTGIGGYNTSDLIQAGTSQDTLPVAGPQYYAWYEILPASETQISGCTGDANCTVNPGDSVTVDIHNTGGNAWQINMSDNGKWTYSKSLTYASTESSAEWILEAPTLVAQTVLANVGTTTFDPSNTFAFNGGTAQTIAKGSPVAIDLGLVGPANEAIPSALDSDGDGFNDCSYALSCAPPAS
jgi:hypothetical protein